MQLVFDNYYMYGGLKNGTQCWASNKLTGKYGELDNDQCNKTCKDGSKCGGLAANSKYRLNFEKNKLCEADIIFNELDREGKIMENSKGELKNPSGDGKVFIWSFGDVDVYKESFNLTALRNKYGDVKGFFTGPDSPYYNDGLKFINWHQIEEKGITKFNISAMGITFVGKDDFLPSYNDTTMDKIFEKRTVETLKAKDEAANIADLEAQLDAQAEAEKQALLAQAIAGLGGDVDEATLAILQAQVEADAERNKLDQLAKIKRERLDQNAEEERQRLQEEAEAESQRIQDEADAESQRIQDEAEAEKQAIIDATELEKQQILEEAAAEKQRLLDEA